ncbi:MAG: tRNA (adenosine(37)-N6)-threonylcarbamoyltransferase complex dimerization subunit type 1 TsaB [Polyangiaceae bacterium]
MIVLALSTSTARGSVAVTHDDRVLAEITHDDPRGHAEHLFELIDAALSRAGVERSAIQLVACDVGPGSFTGVRIAVSSAKGIALGLGVPLAGVVSLDAMVASAREKAPPGARIAAAIDAKKDEVYVAVHDPDRVVLAPCHVARAAAPDRMAALGGDRVLVSIADTADLLTIAGPSAVLALCEPPRAPVIARLAAARLAALATPSLSTDTPSLSTDTPSPSADTPSLSTDPADVVPLYVRAPDAIPSVPVA